jgi:hypothetical protein
MKVLVVFFCYLMQTPNLHHLIHNYVVALNDTRLIHQNFASLHVALSGDYHLFETISRLFSVFPRSNITHTHGNSHEYPGIFAAWSLASHYDLVVYFHCKGLTHNTQQISPLFTTVIKPWRKILKIFRTQPHTDRVALLSSPEGYSWCNYWWARSSYLLSSPEPQKKTLYLERWYYEIFLGLRKNQSECALPVVLHHQLYCFATSKNVYSLVGDRVGLSFSAVEAGLVVNALQVERRKRRYSLPSHLTIPQWVIEWLENEG